MLQVPAGAVSGPHRYAREVEIPSLGRRLLALLIDWIIAALSAVALAGVDYPPKNVEQNLIITAFFVAEVGLLTGLVGMSIGKRLLGMRVENPAGRPIGIPRALLRTLLLSIVLPALIMTDDKRGLHDLAAGSRVIKA
ncbi:MAG: hypothetical protein JWQ91_2446 [Aeromicrobium sp.]|jgi:uncharacterized RDD family membrane protein YckC|nr:hypothetical protein [Aeromicrobium sp.]